MSDFDSISDKSASGVVVTPEAAWNAVWEVAGGKSPEVDDDARRRAAAMALSLLETARVAHDCARNLDYAATVKQQRAELQAVIDGGHGPNWPTGSVRLPQRDEFEQKCADVLNRPFSSLDSPMHDEAATEGMLHAIQQFRDKAGAEALNLAWQEGPLPMTADVILSDGRALDDVLAENERLRADKQPLPISESRVSAMAVALFSQYLDTSCQKAGEIMRCNPILSEQWKRISTYAIENVARSD